MCRQKVGNARKDFHFRQSAAPRKPGLQRTKVLPDATRASTQACARMNLSAWSPLPAASPPLSPASSLRSHVAIHTAVLEHLCALPPPPDLSLLTHLHTPPTSCCLTKCDLWFSPVPTIHLGTPKCWVIVLNACLASRPNSSLRSKLSFLLAHSDLRLGDPLASIKAPGRH